MRKAVKTKSSFGTVRVDHFSPSLPAGVPKAINVVLSFEEALKLHIGLLQALGKLNSYNRNTVAGKATAIDLCIFTDSGRITITEDELKPAKTKTKG